jgi:hypothetical protein
MGQDWAAGPFLPVRDTPTLLEMLLSPASRAFGHGCTATVSRNV